MSGYKHKPSHLDVEQPLFARKPHVWVQWKGTDVCADIHCACGCHSHFDGGFMYYVRCPRCGKVWEVGTHVTLHEVPEGMDLDSVSAAIQEGEEF